MANLGGVDSARAIATLGNWGNLRRLIDQAVASGELEFELEVHSRYYAQACSPPTSAIPAR